ncbi:type II secretion system F family protein [Cohnella cholangitidis]|uniref:Type II secretion protein F n=1 Tax=Cohnella cholangitidis TaxID=2598458 RepID=A0A7G5C2C5_9BACL|nr:type II secretion system F family protein [Cohnella cholangitidis]QMV43359.1 type II secretion protein F [Cohnella cholangitidis]
MNGLLMTCWMVGLVALYAWLLVQALRTRGLRRFSLRDDPFIVLLTCRAVWPRVQPLLHKQRISLSILNGGTCSQEKLVSWVAEAIGLSYLVLLGTGLLAAGSGNLALLFMGGIVAGCIPMLRAKELSGKVKKRQQAIVMELPELLSKLLLMVNAGENVMKALARTVEQKRDSHNPLYAEMNAAIEGMKRGESLSTALEELGRRCAVPEVKLFATTLLINARRGGDAFVPALRELTRQMWDKRKAIARTLGEQASSRLAFPLTIVFLLIMVLVGAPTIFMM